MNETEWLVSPDPQAMLDFLRGKVSDRKLRLFAVGCCNRISHLWNKSEGEQLGIEVAERFADGLATVEELHAAECYAEPVPIGGHGEGGACYNATAAVAWTAASLASRTASEWIGGEAISNASRSGSIQSSAPEVIADAAQIAERMKQSNLLRCVVGCRPFRSVLLSPVVLTWNGGTVVRLAESIYNNRTFDNLPILADALEEAGCIDRSILDHCRQHGDHVRGCWVVDLLLGKK